MPNQLVITVAPKTRAEMGVGIRLYRLLSRWGRRRLTCVLLIAVFTFGFRLALTPVLPHPQPAGHDEFAYLLGADLLAHGRVAEPAHPLWKFFESVHVLSRPVYAPKYPPAQSAFLALGQVVFNDPFYGVLLSVALFAAAVCWMLQIYVGPAWALLGGICTALYFGAGHYWTERYWGGAVTGLGAALLVGAFGRLMQWRNPYFGAAFGAGALLLAASRPYESSILILFLCASLTVSFWRKRRLLQTRMVAPAVLSLSAAFFVLLGYNHAVTGNALKMPYVLHLQQYASAPPFWFMPALQPKRYENPGIQHAYEDAEKPEYKEVSTQSPAGSVGRNLLTILVTIIYDGGVFGLAPLMFIPLLWRDSTIRFYTWCAVLLTAALVVETYMSLHYAAPLLVVGTLLSCLILDRLWKIRRTKCADRILLACVLSVLLLAGPVWRAVRAMEGVTGKLYPDSGFGLQRAQVVQTIMNHPGNHVVFVHYTPQQSPYVTWVANGADIDSSRLIWAHDRGGENRELQEYFKDRTFWSLEYKEGVVSLLPYNAATASR